MPFFFVPFCGVSGLFSRSAEDGRKGGLSGLRGKKSGCGRVWKRRSGQCVLAVPEGADPGYGDSREKGRRWRIRDAATAI